MAKTLTNFRITDELLSAVDEAAELEGRGRTDLVEYVLSKWLRETYPGLWTKAFPELAEKRKQYLVDKADPK